MRNASTPRGAGILAKPGKILNNRAQPYCGQEREEKTVNEAWTRDEKGNIVVFPLAGYETMVVENQALALRLPFMVQGDQTSPSGSLQLIISNAADVRDLAQALIAAAEQIEQAGKGA
jgi:hypothetical protein